MKEPIRLGSAVSGRVEKQDAGGLIRDLRVPSQRGISPTLVQLSSDFAVADINGEPGARADVGITMPSFNDTDYLLLSFRGLPKGFSLSSGFRTAENWLVSAHEAKDLKLIVPEDFSGSFLIEVQLIRGRNVEPITQSVRVNVQPSDAERESAAQTRVTSGKIPQPLPSEINIDQSPSGSIDQPRIAGPQAAIDPEKEEKFLITAKLMLQQNDISAARLIYARLAREGSARGALTLAQTYDSAFLSNYNVAGMQANMEKAKYWYGVAASLGSEDASGRLLALESARR